VQSWLQSFYVGCVGLQTLLWPLFFATRCINTLRTVAVIQVHTTGPQERQWGGCAKALGSSMWCIRCQVAYREATRLFRGSCGAPSVPAHPTLCTAGSVPSAAGAGSAMEDAGAENTFQEDMDMPDVSLTKSALVHEVSHSGLEPAHLVLAVISLTPRSCRRVCCTESRGMRLTVLRSTSSTSI